MGYGIFGQRRPANIDPRLGQDIMREMGIGTPPTPPKAAPQAKRGLFAPGGTGRAIAGTIGDVLLQRGGLAPIYAPTMQAQQKTLLDQAQRDAEHNEWISRQQWERQNPMPSTAQPYRWESNDGDVYQLDPNNQPQRVFDDPTPRMQFIPDGLGGGQWLPVPGAASQQASPDSTPGEEDGYRYTPGPGGRANQANWKPVASNEQGGATLGAAYRSRSITPAEAATIRQSLGAGGQAAFDKWMRDNNITIGDR